MHTDRLSLWLWLLALALVALAYRVLFIGSRSLALADWRTHAQTPP